MIKPWIRKIIFWSFIIFFFISAPLSVLYTAGFRYNFQNNSIIRTGVISTSSIPRNAAITLNDKETGNSTPYVLKRLMPGEYNISLSRSNFHEWSGEVEVKSGTTTLVQPVILFRDAKPEQILQTKIETAATNNLSTAAYIVRDGGWSEIWYTNFSNFTPKMVGRFVDSSLSKNVQLTWSHNNNFLLIFDPTTKYTSVLNNEGEAVNIEPEILQSSEAAFWHPSDDSLLYIKTKTDLKQIDLVNNQTRTFKNSNAATVALDASVLSFVENGTEIEFWQTSGEDRRLVALLPKSEYTIKERDGSFLILTDEKNRLLLINLHADQPILLSTKANTFDWLEQENALVWSDGIEINVYNADSHVTDFIARQSKEIKLVLWHTSGNAIFILSDNELSAIDRHLIAKKRQTTPLLENVDIKNFWISSDTRYINFIGSVKNEKGLYRLKIR